MNEAKSWWIFQGSGTQLPKPPALPKPPPWRRFSGAPAPSYIVPRPSQQETERGRGYRATDEQRLAVNMALYLRRPLLVTGKPGSGKSTLAYAVAHELDLGAVLHWPITTRSSLQDGLYRYDAVGNMGCFRSVGSAV